jgi:putative ABC transport system ATP-binding protein
MTGALIETLGLSKEYRLGAVLVPALSDISITVGRGEFVAVMGRSGSGKSTLMNQIGCLDTPSAGTYRFDGVDVSTLPPDQLAALRNRKIGFCFQQYNLLPRATALANVELPLIYGGVPPRVRAERAAAVLAAVGLGDRGHHLPSQLSGGQQQRVAIARALVNHPVLILADEPTGTLDTKTGLEVLGLLESLNRTGITIVLVTHDADIAGFARRMISLRDGRVVDDRMQASSLDTRPVLDALPVAAMA